MAGAKAEAGTATELAAVRAAFARAEGQAAAVLSAAEIATSLANDVWLAFKCTLASLAGDGADLAESAQEILLLGEFLHPSVLAARVELANTPVQISR